MYPNSLKKHYLTSHLDQYNEILERQKIKVTGIEKDDENNDFMPTKDDLPNNQIPTHNLDKLVQRGIK
jgi:hypothetical protein